MSKLNNFFYKIGNFILFFEMLLILALIIYFAIQSRSDTIPSNTIIKKTFESLESYRQTNIIACLTSLFSLLLSFGIYFIVLIIESSLKKNPINFNMNVVLIIIGILTINIFLVIPAILSLIKSVKYFNEIYKVSKKNIEVDF